MEHIVQFGISFDDQRITQAVMDKAEKVILDDLKQKVNDKLFESRYYGGHGDPKNGLSDWMKHRVEDFLTDNKDAIIEMAGRLIAEKLSRTKAAKALVGGASDG